ncbi:MAG: hypothetical protein HRU25_12150 [Psychrobium sp.]|nr:hypothetical protein [Psychrobium sp.]
MKNSNRLLIEQLGAKFGSGGSVDALIVPIRAQSADNSIERNVSDEKQ